MSACDELCTDTPINRKQAVMEACAAVESVMKLLLGERDGTEAAKRRSGWSTCSPHGIADTTMAEIVLAPSASASAAPATARGGGRVGSSSVLSGPQTAEAPARCC